MSCIIDLSEVREQKMKEKAFLEDCLKIYEEEQEKKRVGQILQEEFIRIVQEESFENKSNVEDLYISIMRFIAEDQVFASFKGNAIPSGSLLDHYQKNYRLKIDTEQDIWFFCYFVAVTLIDQVRLSDNVIIDLYQDDSSYLKENLDNISRFVSEVLLTPISDLINHKMDITGTCGQLDIVSAPSESETALHLSVTIHGVTFEL